MYKILFIQVMNLGITQDILQRLAHNIFLKLLLVCVIILLP